MTIYSINSVKANQNGWIWYRQTQDNGKTFIEAIDKNEEMEFELNLNQKDRITKELKLDYKEDYLSLDRILKCIYQFSDDLIENEIDFAHKYRIDFWKTFT